MVTAIACQFVRADSDATVSLLSHSLTCTDETSVITGHSSRHSPRHLPSTYRTSDSSAFLNMVYMGREWTSSVADGKSETPLPPDSGYRLYVRVRRCPEDTGITYRNIMQALGLQSARLPSKTHVIAVRGYRKTLNITRELHTVGIWLQACRGHWDLGRHVRFTHC